MCDTSHTPAMQKSQKILILSISCSLLLACATEKYTAKPLSIEKTTAKIFAKDPSEASFKNYLIKQGYRETELPFKSWGLDELTLCALYFHSKLDVAKAQLGLVNAQIDSAGQKQNPILNANLAHSDQANGDKRPWAYGLNVEIPIETTNKRETRIEEAQANAAASRMDVASTAWQLRSQIAKDLLEYHETIANAQLIQTELTTQTEIANMLQKRGDKGLASKTELSFAQLTQLKTQSTLNNEQAKSAEMNARLASDVGLTLEKFKQFSIKNLDIDTALSQQISALGDNFSTKNLQETALLNRIDIRRALAKYAAAEAKIKLEIARKTPDISLSPGIAFEYGDSIWSLGFSTLLNLLRKNPTLINEAKQLREIEGAQFEALQAQIIGDLTQHLANYEASKQSLNQAQSQYASQLQHMQKLQKQFDAGLTDRLELKQASLSNIALQAQVLNSKFKLLKAANDIEDVMQHPLYNNFQIPNLTQPNQ